MVTLVCQHCGIEYQHDRRTGKFCSSSCSAKATNLIRKKRSLIERTCNRCKVKFLPANNTASKKNCPACVSRVKTKDDTHYKRSHYKKWYTEKLDKALAYLGGKCCKCGTTARLQFDHIDPETKNNDVTQLLTYNWDRHVLPELKLCQLLCFECHMQKTCEENGKVCHEQKFTTLYCDHCGTKFYRGTSMTLRDTRMGKKNVYCSRVCKTLHSPKT